MQERFKNPYVRIIPFEGLPEYVASVDAAFLKDKIIAVACLFKYPELIFLEHKVLVRETDFPYISGFLAFREGPAITRVINKLKFKPDIILFDGQGIAHPN